MGSLICDLGHWLDLVLLRWLFSAGWQRGKIVGVGGSGPRSGPQDTFYHERDKSVALDNLFPGLHYLTLILQFGVAYVF